MILPRIRPITFLALLAICVLAGSRPLALSGVDGLLAQRSQAALPHVHFVATGGTISNKDGGRLTAEELAKNMPGVERFARVTHEQFTNLASSELTLAH